MGNKSYSVLSILARLEWPDWTRQTGLVRLDWTGLDWTGQTRLDWPDWTEMARLDWPDWTRLDLADWPDWAGHWTDQTGLARLD